MKTTLSNPKKSIFIYLALTVIVCAVQCWFHNSVNITMFDSLPMSRVPLPRGLFFNTVSYYFCFSLILSCIFYALTYNDNHNRRLILSSLGMAFLLASPYHFFMRISTPDIFSLLSMSPAFLLMLYIGHSFHYAYHHDNTWKVSYSTLFFAVWDTLIRLLVTFFLVGLGLSIIFGTNLLFQSIGYSILDALFFDNFYSITIINASLFFMSLCYAQHHPNMIHQLRHLLIRFMQLNFPLLALISSLYFILYLIQLASHLVYDPHVLKNVLSALVSAGILLFNANFQTGKVVSIFPSWVELGLKIYSVFLLCLCIILISLVVTQDKPSPDGSLMLGLALLYCCIEAIGAFLTKEERPVFIAAYNIKIALLFLLAMLLINNPLITHQWYQHHSTVSPLTVPIAPGIPIVSGLPNDRPPNNVPGADNLSIDSTLSALQLYWGPHLDANTFVAGNQNHIPIYICRVSYLDSLQIGVLKSNQCVITFAGKSIRVNNPQILEAHDRTGVIWSSYPSTYPTVILAKETDTRSYNRLRYLTPCQTVANGQLYIGKVVAGHCNVSLGDSEHILPIKSILVAGPPAKPIH